MLNISLCTFYARQFRKGNIWFIVCENTFQYHVFCSVHWKISCLEQYTILNRVNRNSFKHEFCGFAITFQPYPVDSGERISKSFESLNCTATGWFLKTLHPRAYSVNIGYKDLRRCTIIIQNTVEHNDEIYNMSMLCSI